MSNEMLGLWVVIVSAVLALAMTVITSVVVTLAVVRRKAAVLPGPNALQRWFARHAAARGVMVVAAAIVAFVPAFFFRGLKAAGVAALGWARRMLLGAAAETPTRGRETGSARHQTYPTAPIAGSVDEPEAHMRSGARARAPSEPPASAPVSVVSGLPTSPEHAEAPAEGGHVGVVL